MAAPLLFISDLHLEESRPDITNALLNFLHRIRGNCHALYILGDLFEVWIGDDEITELNQVVAQALSELASAGTDIFLMHGNRDFLIGPEYASRCAASIIREPHIVVSGGAEFLLLHGDSLCTDDVDYQNFRQMVRAEAWQQQFLAQPLEQRREFARQAREQSRAATAGKEMGIMDVNPDAVQQLLQDTEQVSLIHGHTHRPARHRIELTNSIRDQQQASRLVLGDWDKLGWYGELRDGSVDLHSFPLV